jgi:GntR family transcriptional regulator/MocR family aminotransferase
MRVPFAAAGARIVPVRVDAEGLVVDELPVDARIVCVCPSHQFPLGMPMSLRRREALLSFARQTGAAIVEDDYDGEFRYHGSPLEALRGPASSSYVFYVGSFSKCMFPAIRLGFLVAPGWALSALIAAKNSSDWHCPVPTQAAVAEFIRDGHLTRHIRRARRIYRDRRDYLLLLLSQLPDTFSVVQSFYGMHLTAIAHDDVDCDAVSYALSQRGIMVHSLSRYSLGAEGRNGLVLGYGAADCETLQVAVQELRAEALQANC